MTPTAVDAGWRVSCVLPACNEADNLARTVGRVSAALQRHTREHEIIVVDDGSRDGTPRVLRDLCAQYDRLRVVTHAENRGYGSAILSGFAGASFPLLFFTDADDQYEPDDIRLLLERSHEADVVVGYRITRQDTWSRRVLSRGFNALVRWVLGVSPRDVNCAFKLIHRDILRTLTLESSHFCINAELLARARNANLNVVEVAVRHRPRYAGRSTVTGFLVFRTIRELARVRRRIGFMPWGRVAHSTPHGT